MATEQGRAPVNRAQRIVAAIDRGKRSPMLLAVPALAELIPELREWIIETDGQLRELRARADANAQRVDRLEARQ